MARSQSDLPLVSVAIPAYNQESFVEQALESVLAQDYPELQIVVGDDGSRDRTPAILREYKKRHPGAFKLVLGEANQGITANCNAILDACEGKYVAWLGGDDLFKAGKVRAQVEAMEAHPSATISHHPVEWFDSASGVTIGIANGGDRTWHDIEELVCKGCFGSGTSVMHRREAAPAHGFRRELPCASDWLFFIEIALAGEVLVLDVPLSRYRHHPKQISVGTPSAQVFMDALRTLDLLEQEGLAPAPVIARGRANVMHWEAVSRMKLGAERQTVRALLLRGIRHDPLYPAPWKRLVELQLGPRRTEQIRSVKRKLRPAR